MPAILSGIDAETGPAVVSRGDWLLARKALLQQEKALTRLRDRVDAARRAMPWVRLERSYRFDSPDGPVTLDALFDGRRQLLVHHHMFAPGWTQGCAACAVTADHLDVARRHFERHDLSFVAVSRASPAQIEAYRRRMGWGFRWVSAEHGGFNDDFNVSFAPRDLASGKVYYNYAAVEARIEELPGLSVFYRKGPGEIFHTYSTYARGIELLDGAALCLDLTPGGRVRTRHDEACRNEGPPARRSAAVAAIVR
ncbi:MAG: DUF899 family protein [Pseudomonadota bacterium]|nr:DUF899 family protein [Pseudomonadota bacterium]